MFRECVRNVMQCSSLYTNIVLSCFSSVSESCLDIGAVHMPPEADPGVSGIGSTPSKSCHRALVP